LHHFFARYSRHSAPRDLWLMAMASAHLARLQAKLSNQWIRSRFAQAQNWVAVCRARVSAVTSAERTRAVKQYFGALLISLGILLSAYVGGTYAIAAHRDTFFRHIYELNAGDDIYVQRHGKQFHYVVTGKRVVQPTDVSVLDNSSEARLTLITCYPVYFIGPAPERLVIFAKLAKQV